MIIGCKLVPDGKFKGHVKSGEKKRFGNRSNFHLKYRNYDLNP
jgi:hypothetical protein